ncbi:hypothetical protein BDZ89DRAFT_1144953 [Hymenopellis radicata]|nr:hypothetical protein BDZ89DRAFT_1144953 [Hymenopellis radicata]
MPAKTTTTFLILILAQAHSALAASGFKSAPPNTRRRRAAPTVTFHAPTASSTYAPGTSILVSWASDTEVVSPSFRLCVVSGSAAGKRHSYKAKDEKESDNDEDDSSGNDDDGDGSCGAAVWATVKNDGDEYSIQVTAPAVNAPTRFYLEMRDDFDDGMRTDIFTIADGDSAATQDVGGQAPMQAGDFSDTNGSSTTTSAPTGTDDLPSTANADSSPGASSSNAGHSSTGNAGGSSSNTNSSSNASPMSSPQTGASGSSPNTGAPNSAPNYPPYTPYTFPSTPALLATRSPPPVAAFAVPLSIVGAILLIAGLALFRRRRDDKVKGEGLQNVGVHQNDTEKGPGAYPFATGGMQGLPMSGAMGMGGGMYSGVPASGMGIMPVPLYMPREVTRDAGYYGSRRSQDRLERDDSYRLHSRDTYRSRSRDEYHSRSRSTRSHHSSVTGDVLFDYLATPSGGRVFTPPSAHVRRSAQTRMDTKEVFGRVGEKLKGAGGVVGYKYS